MLAYHTCVGAFVDCVGNDAQLCLTQGQIARVGELQGFLVLVPAAEVRFLHACPAHAKAPRIYTPRVSQGAPSPKPAQCWLLLTILCLSCGGSSVHSGRSCSYPLSPTSFSFLWVMWWWPRWEMGILLREWRNEKSVLAPIQLDPRWRDLSSRDPHQPHLSLSHHNRSHSFSGRASS